MKKFKLIKEFPDSPKLGTELIKFNTRNDNPGIFYRHFIEEDGYIFPDYAKDCYGELLVENWPEFWQEITIK